MTVPLAFLAGMLAMLVLAFVGVCALLALGTSEVRNYQHETPAEWAKRIRMENAVSAARERNRAPRVTDGGGGSQR